MEELFLENDFSETATSCFVGLALRKLAKRDSVTKLRSLNEISVCIAQRNGSLLENVQSFCLAYEEHWMHPHRLVRKRIQQILHQILEFSVEAKLKVASHIKHIILGWIAAQFDKETEVCEIARLSWSIAFKSVEKAHVALTHFGVHILATATRLFEEHTPQYLKERNSISIDEIEAYLDNLRSSIIRGLKVVNQETSLGSSLMEFYLNVKQKCDIGFESRSSLLELLSTMMIPTSNSAVADATHLLKNAVHSYELGTELLVSASSITILSLAMVSHQDLFESLRNAIPSLIRITGFVTDDHCALLDFVEDKHAAFQVTCEEILSWITAMEQHASQCTSNNKDICLKACENIVSYSSSLHNRELWILLVSSYASKIIHDFAFLGGNISSSTSRHVFGLCEIILRSQRNLFSDEVGNSVEDVILKCCAPFDLSSSEICSKNSDLDGMVLSRCVKVISSLLSECSHKAVPNSKIRDIGISILGDEVLYQNTVDLISVLFAKPTFLDSSSFQDLSVESVRLFSELSAKELPSVTEKQRSHVLLDLAFASVKSKTDLLAKMKSFSVFHCLMIFQKDNTIDMAKEVILEALDDGDIERNVLLGVHSYLKQNPSGEASWASIQASFFRAALTSKSVSASSTLVDDIMTQVKPEHKNILLEVLETKYCCLSSEQIERLVERFSAPMSLEALSRHPSIVYRSYESRMKP